MNAKVTITFEMNNLIDEQALQEVYDGSLLDCVKNTIEDEGLFGVLELDTVKILKVEEV